MLRGVNRQIIEINDTGSEIFEKAIFFIKSTNQKNDADMRREAKQLINAYFDFENEPHTGFLRYTENKKKAKRSKLTFSFVLALTAIGLSVVGAILLKIL